MVQRGKDLQRQIWWRSEVKYLNKFPLRRSDEVLLPLQNELLELEETIRDEHTRIKSIKSRMIKNEQIIQNLINNVISIKNEDFADQSALKQNMRKK